MNAELVFRLREALDRLDALPEPPAVEGEESAADTLERLYRHAVQCTELIAGLKGKK